MKPPKSRTDFYSNYSTQKNTLENLNETPNFTIEQHNTLAINNNFSTGIVEPLAQPHGQHADNSLSPSYQQSNSSLPITFSTAIHSMGNLENNEAHLTGTSTMSSYRSIPFVQIHTTDVHPPSTSFGNVFRREANSSNAEIKSEPIKSESADSASKERSNTTPTPSVKDSRCSSRDAATPIDNQNEMSSNILPNIHKCPECPFISLSEPGIKAHKLKLHPVKDLKKSNIEANLQCPGCDNMFCVYDPLEVHLRKDHLMSLKELKILMEVYKKIYTNVQTVNKKSTTKKDSTTIPTKAVQNDGQHKSRIYLKNVDCLREPTREPIEQQENQITQHASVENSCEVEIINGETPLDTVNEKIPTTCANILNTENTQLQAPKKQKISIKSVEMLREPALLHRDYCFFDTGSGMNGQNHFNFPLSTGNANESNTNCQNRNANVSCVDVASESVEPRRPKIYVKHGDVLKEPISFSNSLNALNMQCTRNEGGFNYLPTESPQNEGDFTDNVEQVFEPACAQLSIGSMPEQYIFENNNNHGFFQSANEGCEFDFNSNLASTGNYSNRLDCPTSTSSSSTTPIITEATPPPPAMINITNPLLSGTFASANQMPQQQQQQKIFIRSFDHLKEPQALEIRGMLHLRTVDELNLMNKNEVENLIAPNLDNGQHGGVIDLNEIYNNQNEEAKASEQPVPEDDSIKFDGLSWVADYGDYDLGDDIDCIMIGTEETVPSTEMLLKSTPKLLNDLQTPQVSLISVRDIEALTDGQQQIQNSFDDINDFNTISQTVNANGTANQDVQEEMPENENYQDSYSNDGNAYEDPSSTSQTMSQQTEINPEQTHGPSVTMSAPPTQHHATDLSPSLPIPIVDDIPPLAPVSNTPTDIPRPLALPIIVDVPPLAPVSKLTPDHQNDDAINNVSVPPLVPVPPLVLLNSQTQNAKNIADKSKAPAERGRIYVANNLLAVQTEQPAPFYSVIDCGTSVRGRPFGLKQTAASCQSEKLQNISQMETNDSTQKCSVKGCNFRFMKQETLDYHLRCHITYENSVPTNEMQCPECKLTDFSNWNTLHTHLWRCHLIDMELYSCHLCSFKTPLYSHLKNTHLRIHSNERNYKCDECEKAFKNARQLKNHRRHHRKDDNLPLKLTLHHCKHCGSVFKHLKSLREHLCKHSEILSCKKCGHISNSKDSLKLHMNLHGEAKRFVCETCGHTTHDHNVFRRHKMTHDSKKMYCCPHCDYKSIQSYAFQKHVQHKHPDHADEIIHKCSKCSFSSVNKTLLELHLARHEMQTALNSNRECESIVIEDCLVTDGLH